MDQFDDAQEEPALKKRPLVMAPRDATSARPSPSLPAPRDPVGDVDLRNPSTRPEIERTMGGQPWDAERPMMGQEALTPTPEAAPVVVEDHHHRHHHSAEQPRHPVTGQFLGTKETTPDDEVSKFNSDVEANIARRKAKAGK